MFESVRFPAALGSFPTWDGGPAGRVEARAMGSLT
jgi:hypothetical protein